MKKRLLLLPIIALLSLSSCGEKSNPLPPAPELTEDGDLPEGGETIEDVTQRKQVLAKALKNGSDSLRNSDHIGVSFNISHFIAGFDAPKFNMSVDTGHDVEFLISADHLFNGTKENTRIGVAIPRPFTVYANLNSGVEDFEYSFEDRVTFNEASVYLANGNIYADLSELNLEDVVGKVCTFVSPFTDGILGEESTIQAFIEQFANNPAMFTLLLKAALGENFNYKFAYEGAIPDDKYPLVNIEALDDEKAEESVEDNTKSFEEATGLKWDDVCKVQTYYDIYTGLEFNVHLSDIKTDTFLPETTINLGFTFHPESYLKMVLVTDEQNRPIKFSVKLGTAITIHEDSVSEALGGEVVFAIDTAVGVNIDYDKGPVNFPENYDDYTSAGTIISVLFPPKGE